MKKRVFAFLMAMTLFTGSVFISFADNEKDKVEATSLELSTGTQEQALEDANDIDADIKENIKASIPDAIEEIRVGSADEFLKFVDNCKLDTWSLNKKIIITDDISLIGKDFKGVPSFGGMIDGQGHTISDFNITGGMSYVGFFTYLQSTAVITSLNVAGSIIPEEQSTIIGGFCGDNAGFITDCSFKGVVKGKDYVGGICGINELTGDIRFCTSEGFISGTHFTGGIAGKNDGNIANCRNEALINTTNTDTEITIDSMEKLNSIVNLLKNGIDKSDDEASSDVTVSDTGGIAGLSIGIITRCINNGEIGYDHVGYNVGGIAGRQSGYVVSCSNNGLVKGRKDVGGIVGQAEPYITVDFATDIAYQLSEAVAKLHDTVSATLNDTKNQSDVVSARLAVISKFTGQAVEDTRFIANGVTNYANGVSGAATEAFSRVDYLMEEASKKNGVLDKTNGAVTEAKDSASSIKKAVNDLDVEKYIKSDDLRTQYKNAQIIINSATEQYERGVLKSYNTYYNMYIHDFKGGLTGDPLKYFDSSDNVVDESNWSLTDMDDYPNQRADSAGNWKHDDGNGTLTDFPITDDSADMTLHADAMAFAELNSGIYAKSNYENTLDPTKKGAKAYEDDISAATEVITATYIEALPEMSDSVRSDAESAIGHLESSADNLVEAGKQTKSALSNVANKDDITFPQFDSEFKNHTNSLADNMAAMNDNFGLLNSEINNATGVLVSDLQEVNDQFNNILNLYTDAMDGVLEKDYTNIFSDDSLKDASYTTDATIDSCFNFGECRGDIDISGIAGTMAIEYDFDKESDITGLKQSGINGSYLTKCVLRDNRNYGDVSSEKNYAGGICGLQEMGTILNCGSYSRVLAKSGSYVGGVAGSSYSYIVECYAKGELDGTSYIGGIAGDGKNIRECLSIVSALSDADWCGAIAGHVAENGEIRDNFFVSDTLAGIDRVSYSLKAEPVSYDAVFNNKVFKTIEKESSDKEAQVVPLKTGSDEKENDEEEYRDLPYEFRTLTVSFILEDEDIEGGKEKIGRINKNYGERLSQEEYPGISNKDGFYPVWDIEEVDSLTCDMTITATYKRYRTTLADNYEDENMHQSELLVDGKFKETDEFLVEKTFIEDLEELDDDLSNYEVIKVSIPMDGQKTHQIRFKSLSRVGKFTSMFGKKVGEPTLFLVDGEKRHELTPTGKMGEYTTYEVEGNDFTLAMDIGNAVNIGIIILSVVVVALILIIVLLVVTIIIIKKHGGKVPKLFSGVMEKVTKRIESKEQLFYDDSKDAENKKSKSQDESEEMVDTEDGKNDIKPETKENVEKEPETKETDTKEE